MKRIITANDMDKDLRFRGTIARWIVPYYSERKFHFFNTLTTVLLSWSRPRGMRKTNVKVKRTDYSDLSIRVFKPKKQ